MAAATRTADAALDSGTHCRAPSFEGTEWAGLQADGGSGQFVVHLRCQVSYSGLGLLGIPGSHQIDAQATVPLDPYRSY